MGLDDRLSEKHAHVVVFAPPPGFGRHIGGLDPSANLAGSGDAEKALVDEWLQFASKMQVGSGRGGTGLLLWTASCRQAELRVSLSFL